MRLRPAELEDGEMLRRWRNDSLTRSASHTSAPVSRADHLAWLAQVLREPSRRLYVAEADGVAVGTVRADWRDESWLLSWTVAPEHRGRGYGKAMVALAAEMTPGRLRAEIKAGNAASVAIAEAAGLRLSREADGLLLFHRG
jgi:RimJ/RimL family protein N-acetyltransferase